MTPAGSDIGAYYQML